ncbi:MAG: hypothetical protein ACOY3I_04025 [Verrucomicrobiota bacterium]
MKFVIDSEIVELPQSKFQSFNDCCHAAMEWLLERNRSIQSCHINGKEVSSLEDANQLFASAQSIEVQSVPLNEAMESTVALRCTQWRGLEEQCENLVTDCLLAEPLEIAKQWQDLCQILNEQIKFIPNLSFWITDDQVAQLADQDFKELGQIMNRISEDLAKADVVAFSDILEVRLLPWMKNMRGLFEATLQKMETNK